MHVNRKKSINLYLIIALAVSVIAGFVCDYYYDASPEHAIHIKKFQSEIIKKESQASETLDELKLKITHSPIDSLIQFQFKDKDISYFVFDKKGLIFWSDNHLDISNITFPDTTNWQFTQLPNSQCICHLIRFKSTKILALINIKNNFPYENAELINTFSESFKMDKQIQLIAGKATDKQAIFSSNGKYLFTLSEPKTPIYNETWALIGLIINSFAFLLLFIIYAHSSHLIKRKYLKLKTFVYLSFSVGIALGFCLYFDFPTLMFLNKLFTPLQYASNPFLASISHLTVVTEYLMSTIYLFYFHTNTNALKSRVSHIFLQIIYALYFVLVYYILSSLIYNSSIQLNILSFNNVSILSLWVHFLILVFGIGLFLLFFKAHTWYKIKHRLFQAFVIDLVLSALLYGICFLISPENAILLSVSFTALWMLYYLTFAIAKYKNVYGNLAILVFGFTVFLVCNSYIINNNKKINKYKVLTQNIFINGNTENDRMADIMLEELDHKINYDRKIGKLIIKTDSLTPANEYLNRTYLRGFWNKYDMRLNATTIHSNLYNEYAQFLGAYGSKLKGTHFYSVAANESNMTYIGKFQSNFNRSDSIFFFMEFYPRRNFKSYSFPNLLIASAPDIQTQLNIAIAKYENQKLIYSSGKYEYSQDNNWIPKNKTDFFTIQNKGWIYYIYTPNKKSYIVITDEQPVESLAYLLYFIYTFLAFYVLCSLIVWSYLFFRNKENFRIGLTAKFQYTFIALLILSFIGIFYVSVNFIQQKYQDEQITNLDNKKSYIQKALQDLYYWNQDLNALNTQALNFDLQDLSYIYHTDIHVYDNRGVLIGSSQPIIFNKKLISSRIAPKPYFSASSNVNQYEHIGKLTYLTGYTDFNNGDFLQIGYIAVPQFFSQDEIRSEIESFLAVIIHIYLIIIILAVLLSLFIGKQLSAPLIMLENKLKEMRLGRRNEKIEYNLNDEIGQLVIQYNRTVDELEQSAQLLAKSERESAWKSMARQVAHEINNPLTPMKLTIQQLQRTKKMNDERFDDYFEKSSVMLIEQIDNLSRIAGTFSNFARMPEANFEKVDIASKIYSVVQLFANNNEEVQMDYHGEKNGIYVFADPEQLVQVFNNLLKNAIQSIPVETEGIIQISLKAANNRIIIEITDNGIGIDNENHHKLFVPNFTTKTTGMGLGLAISKNIIELSGGNITFTSELNKGTTFVIELPQAE
ncbi:MAG: ATP-binding protein [Paludibacter sp.]|nr:ATP-binding protein [Paludibacter sp.]